jgi:hypothetical protein
MPASTPSITETFPMSTSWITGGEIGRARDEFDRQCSSNAEPARRLRDWQERLRTAEALIASATPDNDMMAVAAAQAEVDVLRRSIGDDSAGLFRSQVQASELRNRLHNRVSELETEYYTALDVLLRAERGQLSYSTYTDRESEVDRAHRRLRELTGA